MQVAIPLFPRFTALDAIGPYEVLQRIPSIDVTFIGHERGEVRSENGMLGITVDATFEEMPHPDIVVFPGGVGTRPLVNDEHVLDVGSTRPRVEHVHDIGVHRLARPRRRRAVERSDRDDTLGVLPGAGSDRRDADRRPRGRAPRPPDHHRRRSIERHRHGPSTRRTARRPHRGAGGAADDRVRPTAAVRLRRPVEVRR